MSIECSAKVQERLSSLQSLLCEVNLSLSTLDICPINTWSQSEQGTLYTTPEIFVMGSLSLNFVKGLPTVFVNL